MYKLCAVLMGGCGGYLLDVSLFPYAKPSGYLAKSWRDETAFVEDAPDHKVADEPCFMVACIRRAIIVATAMLAVALAL
jgi:hypothetical protein